MNIPKYFLHSRIGDSFHFRKVDTPESRTESFTITYIPDGTTIMSGRMGNLIWCRYWDGKCDYGFPGNGTSLSYFTEKIEPDYWDAIEGYNYDLAVREINEYFESSGLDEESANKLNDLFDYNSWQEYDDAHIQKFLTYRDVSEAFPNMYIESHFGATYTELFRHQFEILKQVSPIILEEVRKDKAEVKIPISAKISAFVKKMLAGGATA